MRRVGDARYLLAAPRSFRALPAALLEPAEVSLKEIVVATGVLVLLAVAIFGARVTHGGFAYDDWAISADFQRYGVFGTVHYLFLLENSRPLQGPYAVIYAVIGTHQRAILLWAIATRVGMSSVLYLLLRTLGIERLGAIAIASLSLLLPLSDSLWLWGNAAVISVAVTLYLLGSVAVLKAFRSPRRARMLHAIGLLLYLMSVLLYEIAAVAILASIGLYLVRASPRAAIRRWLLDVSCTVLVLVLITSGKLGLLPGADAHPSTPLSQWPAHLRMILDQGASVLAAAAVPFGSPSTVVVGALLGALALAGAVASRLPSYGPAPRRWAVIGIGGVVVAVAGWAPLIPAVSYYSPGVLGVGNRIDALAGVGISITVFAAAMVAGLLVLGSRSRAWSAALAAIATGVVLVGYVRHDNADRASWNTATALSESELSAMRTALVNPPPHGSRIYLFGAPAFTTPGVPVFAALWDLNGAVQLMWHDSSLGGDPMLPGIAIVCGKTGLYPSGGGLGVAQLTPYGRAIFVDIPGAAPGAAVTTISSPAQCSAVARRLLPG